MACGCNKGKNSMSRGPAVRPGIYNRASVGTLSTPTQVRSQAVVRSQAIAPATPSENGANVAKRKIQALRREALLKAKGR